jgi:hypothetical protein
VTPTAPIALVPRFIRLRDAPRYLGMDKNRFNREVRPFVTVIRIGSQGIAFDRIDLDAWADQHESRNGCPAAQSERRKLWDETSTGECQDSSSVAESGTSTKSYTARTFAKALTQATRGSRSALDAPIADGKGDETFRHARGTHVPRSATKYLKENQHKRSLERDVRALATLDPYIGELTLQRVHHDTLQPFLKARVAAGISPATVNRDLAVVRRILNLCARLWRDAGDRTWLETPPLIQVQRHPNKRQPYPLSIEEQRLLFSELEGHLARIALFKVNTGLREQEVVNLRWTCETPVPELDTSHPSTAQLPRRGHACCRANRSRRAPAPPPIRARTKPDHSAGAAIYGRDR